MCILQLIPMWPSSGYHRGDPAADHWPPKRARWHACTCTGGGVGGEAGGATRWSDSGLLPVATGTHAAAAAAVSPLPSQQSSSVHACAAGAATCICMEDVDTHMGRPEGGGKRPRGRAGEEQPRIRHRSGVVGWEVFCAAAVYLHRSEIPLGGPHPGSWGCAVSLPPSTSSLTPRPVTGAVPRRGRGSLWPQLRLQAAPSSFVAACGAWPRREALLVLPRDAGGSAVCRPPPWLTVQVLPSPGGRVWVLLSHRPSCLGSTQVHQVGVASSRRLHLPPLPPPPGHPSPTTTTTSTGP